MGKITVYENNKRRGSTSQAFNVVTKKELMREHTLDFSILNNNPIYKEITQFSVFENKGQLFDISSIDSDSGKENITAVSAEHVSYRANKYKIPEHYAFVGTVEEIAQDILKVSGAETEFTIGECCDLGTVSFSINNDKEITARAALFGMAALGVEIDYDNFSVNIPQRIGKDLGKTFRFGIDLEDFRRRWQIGNGWTYDIAIADIQKIPNFSGITFSLGDDVMAEDSFIGDSIKNRVISYVENDDNPAENSITMGVFIADAESKNVETDRIANTANDTANTAKSTADEAKKTADNSVQQEEKYSNVSISHENGFMAENKAGTQRVIMNADDCFVVQVLQDGKWVTVNSLEAFGLLVDRLTSSEAKDRFCVKIGKIEETDSKGQSVTKYGLELHDEHEKKLSIFYLNGDTGIRFDAERMLFDVLKSLDFTCGNILRLEALNTLSLIAPNLSVENTDTKDFGYGVTGLYEFDILSSTGEPDTIHIRMVNGIVVNIY